MASRTAFLSARVRYFSASAALQALLVLPALAGTCHAADTAATPLPTITTSKETALCLKNRDWQCAAELLALEYELRGPSSGVQYYLANAYRQLAREAFREKDLARARELYQTALLYHEEDPTLHAELGRIHLEQSEYEPALQSFSTAFDLDDDNPRYAETLAQIHYLSGSIDDAIYYLEKAIGLNPKNSQLRKHLKQMKTKAASEENGTTQLSQVFEVHFENTIDKEQMDRIWNMLEDTWYQVGLELDFYPKRQIPVYMLSRDNFKTSAGAPAWSGGVYEGRISLPFDPEQPELTAEVITHEYTHALLYDAMAFRCPWWLNEGLAQYLSLPGQKRKKAILVAIRGQKRSKGWSKDAPELAGLGQTLKGPKQAAVSYGLALSATEYLIEHYSIVTLRAILHAMADGDDFETALFENTGTTYREFEDNWWRQL